MKKNNIFLRAIALMLAFAFAFTAVPALRLEAKAAKVKDVVPSKVRVYVRSTNDSAINIQLVKKGYKITGLKSNSSDLKVYNTRVQHSDYNEYGSVLHIGCYARKEGTYKVSYTLVNGKKKIKKTTTVYAKDDPAIKSVKFAGQRLDLYDGSNAGHMAKKNSGKFSVKMYKGYKVKKIEVRSYLLNGANPTPLGSKTIKNNATVKLSDVPYTYKDTYGSEVWSSTEHMVAKTEFYITYTDKYSKQEKTTSYELYKLVKWAK